jgi:hypothetical protein
MVLPMPSFTPEDLLLYLYNETSPEMTKAVEEALKNDWTLREKLNVLKISKQRLNNVIESPRTEVILKILNYAREKAKQEA